MASFYIGLHFLLHLMHVCLHSCLFVCLFVCVCVRYTELNQSKKLCSKLLGFYMCVPDVGAVTVIVDFIVCLEMFLISWGCGRHCLCG
jgi:hypothetical protein